MHENRRACDDDLRRAPLLCRLDPEDRSRLVEVVRLRRWQRGETLFREGDPANHLLMILGGRVKVFKTTPTGRYLILEIFGPGDPVGAVAVYEERPYPATAEALQDTEVVTIPRDALFRLLDTRPSLSRGLLLSMTHRLVELTTRLTELTTGRVEPRIARLLLKLATDIGRPAHDGIFIPLSLSRQDLADLIGTTVETSIRVMSRLGKDGVVCTEKSGFTVLDRPALAAIAAE